MLEASRLTVLRAEQELFSNLTFSVSRGQWGWVKGGNGQGKSTLLKLLAGLLPRRQGSSIRWQGRENDRFASSYLENLLYLGHTPPLHPALTPVENLAWLMSLSGTGLQRGTEMGLKTSEKIHQALLSMEVNTLESPCEQLSFGQRQRVSLARLPLSFGKLWLLDEPCTGLDRRGQMLLENCLQQHFALGGVAVIASHMEFKNLNRPQVTLELNAGACTVHSSFHECDQQKQDVELQKQGVKTQKQGVKAQEQGVKV